ncbi:LysR substrate-binding domain-containing protein [Brevundimonas sp.]|jgi:DNA-binding transcriptional LysR family regulator|uniref:LysR substrate-binding domain-containing protein n=1 Tax=Brevundimonas sp. TaxID=1871086 RepID=UPI0037838F42
MKREEMADLTAFVTVADERSFTRAAAKLGLSQSALSQLVARLEQRLGLRLLARTTRSVAPTEAGQRLLETLKPALEDLDASIAALSDLRDKPAGTIRITSVEHASTTYIWPVLKTLLRDCPDISVEIVDDYALADLVKDQFDAGVRLGEQVAKDMIAVRIAPDMPMAVVASPDYFAAHPKPTAPADLVRHRCINLRLPTSGGLYVWGFEKDGQELKVRTEGPLVFNSVYRIRDAAIAGLGVGYLPTDMVRPEIDAGALVAVLDDWCPSLPGYHLYYLTRRQPSPAFALLVKALRYRMT